MTSTETLVLVIALIYLWESFTWIPAGARAFVVDAGSRLRARGALGRTLHSFKALGNRKGAVALAPILLPHHPVFVSGSHHDPTLATRSPSRVARELERFNRATRALRISAMFLGLSIFVWFAPLTLLRGLTDTIWISLPPVVALHIATLVFFWLAHRRLYPALSGSRWLALIEKLLLPPGNIRALDKVSLPYFRGLHPTCVACVLHASRLRGFARGLLLEQPAEHTRTLLGRALEGSGLSLDALESAPDRESPDAKSYCPQCRAQFVLERGVCPDCRTVELKRFD